MLFFVGEKEISVKESLLLVCGERKDPAIFDGIINSYSQSAAYMNWKDRDCFYVTGVSKKGDILFTDSLPKIEEIGRTF